MDVATGAIGSLLPKLDELCLGEYKLSKGVKQDIRCISHEMKSLEATLLKLARVPLDQQNPFVRSWAVEVKEQSYRIEDEVDSFLIGHMKKVTNVFKKCKTHRVFADAMKDTKARVMVMAERYHKRRVDDQVPYSDYRAAGSRISALYQEPTDIIGIEESSEDLIKKIICQDDYSSKRPLKIISIFGSMGLGKTTLAKVVYNKLKGDFDCWTLLPLGREPALKRILMDLLSQLGAQSYQDFSTLYERQLIDALQMLLEKKRYLIVLDDIWDIDILETILYSLVDHDCGSLVIITTRILEVAQRAGEVYKLKPLSHDNSRELFYKKLLRGKDEINSREYKKLFRGKDEIPSELAEVSEPIIKKCGCIPLAIITMARVLLGFPWKEWSVVCNSIGLGHEDDEVVKNIRNISLLSYYDISSILRTCLLYLRIFPEGYMFRKDTLIWKWIAEDFVRDERGQGLFKVGEGYFNELINKSLVQPVEIPHSGIIIGYRVNVMVLDMICFLSKEENFITVLDSHKQDTSDRRQARLLAIQNRVVDEGFVQENEMLANPHMRSFNATKCEFQMMPSLASFQLLRVLSLEDCAAIGGIYHLEHITILVHLRYLGLFNTPIFELPEGIVNLKFLQTLDLRQTKIEDLPHGIVRLTQLKCLRAGSRSRTVPDGMGNLASLEELQLNDVSSSPNIVKELGKLRELRDLKLWIRLSNERSKRDLVESLGDLQKIESLHLDGVLRIEESCWGGYVPSRHLRHVFLGMKFSRLPAWINPLFLPSLSHLSVDVSVVDEEDLLTLGSFPELLSLNLAGEYVCLPDIMGGGAFPSLKYCYTSGMVRFPKGAAPRLEFVSFNVRLWAWKNGSFDLDFRSLLDHPLLQEVRVEIFYTEAQVTEVDEVEAALRNVVDNHPNRVILDISKWKSSVSEQFGSDDDVDGNEYYDDNEEDTDHKYYNDEE